MRPHSAAGGTGGHIFPAQALAEKLIKNNITPILICDDRATKFLQGVFQEIEKFYIHSNNMTGSLDKKIWGIVKLAFSILKVRSYLKKVKPQVVVGFGGYPSFPTLIAAKSLGIKIMLHEQNAVLGRVNRWLAPYVDEICLSFPNTKGLKAEHKIKTHVIGNLIREDILSNLQMDKYAKKRSTETKLLVIGGSQGAQALSEIIPVALKKLPDVLQSRITVYLQARDTLMDLAARDLAGFKGKFIIKPFFNNIAELMLGADLVICRAGASSIAELIVAKKPSILIPLPIATDNHQERNAKYLSDQGLATLLLEKDLSVDVLSKQLNSLLADLTRLRNFSNKFTHIKADNAASDFFKIIKQACC